MEKILPIPGVEYPSDDTNICCVGPFHSSFRGVLCLSKPDLYIFQTHHINFFYCDISVILCHKQRLVMLFGMKIIQIFFLMRGKLVINKLRMSFPDG